MKKVVKYILVIFLLLTGIIFVQNYPASSAPRNLPRLADTNNIRRNLEAIINTPKSRNATNDDVLDSVAEYIKHEFLKSTDRLTTQQFAVDNKFYKNIIASYGPENGPRVIIGAHYDVCGEQDGADDNASGVSGMLELAQLLKDAQLKYRIDLVGYSLEEPPYFGTENMGSFIHAKSLYDGKIDIKGMISLEMIGYYSKEPNSQHYPLGFLKWFYGNKADYITIVQKPFNGDFSRNFKKLAFKNNSLPTKSFIAPSFIGGLDLSDHRNYWKFGYSAVMITNTAFFRNSNYHKKEDMLPTLDIPNIGLVVDGVFRVLTQMN